MAVESVLGGMAANMAESAFKQQMQYQYQKNLNRQAQSYYERDLKLSQQLNIDAQRAAIAQSTRALRDAGISPAMASAGGFSAPAASSPLASSAAGISSGSGAEYVGAITQARLGDAQIENLEAQTQKTNAETDAIRNKNPEEVELLRRQQRNLEALTEKYGTEQLLLGKEYERKLSEDDYVTKRLKNYIQFRVHQAESRGDSVERDLWLSLLDETAAGLTLGTLAGMQRFAQYVNDLDEYDKDAVLRQLHRSIARMQLDDDKLLSVIAHMPENDAALKLAQMAEALANRDFRDAYRKELLPVQKSQGEQDIVSSRHKDFVGMAKDGDIGDRSREECRKGKGPPACAQTNKHCRTPKKASRRHRGDKREIDIGLLSRQKLMHPSRNRTVRCQFKRHTKSGRKKRRHSERDRAEERHDKSNDSSPNGSANKTA